MKKYQYTLQGVDYDVEIIEVDNNIAKVDVNGITFEVEMKQPLRPTTNMAKPKVQQQTPAPSATPAAAPVAPAAPQAPVAAGTGTALKAPLPGTVTDIKVQVGQKVNQGDVVLVLEAMKMQNNIEAETSGTVNSIVVKQGETVMEGAVLLTIA